MHRNSREVIIFKLTANGDSELIQKEKSHLISTHLALREKKLMKTRRNENNAFASAAMLEIAGPDSL